MIQEIWKSVSAYEGFYEVSNLGNVRSITRTITGTSKYGNSFQKIITGKILEKGLGKRGYFIVSLWNNVGRTHYVHRLVIDAFTAVCENKNDINHINGIKTDNRLENLERCTRKHNIQHAVDTGLNPRVFKSDNGRSLKVIDSTTGKIYDTIKDAADDLLFSSSYLAKMLSGYHANKTSMILYEN